MVSVLSFRSEGRWFGTVISVTVPDFQPVILAFAALYLFTCTDNLNLLCILSFLPPI